MPGWFQKPSPPAASAELSLSLAPIFERRFPGASLEDFQCLWLEVAHMVGVSPLELHEDDKPLDLCPPPRWSHINDTLDGLIHLALRARPGTPDTDLRTVGELMDWMLKRFP